MEWLTSGTQVEIETLARGELGTITKRGVVHQVSATGITFRELDTRMAWNSDGESELRDYHRMVYLPWTGVDYVQETQWHNGDGATASEA